MNIKSWTSVFCLVALMFSGGAAQGRALLKAGNGAALPLRLKAQKIEATIEGRLAATTSLMTFENETSQRIEADFIYAAPPGALVTGFAYWFGEEKVVARIVEKERAREIYKYITSRMRDPALVEMIGRNTFHAKIFPVMPNADLRVEVRYLEVLPATAGGTLYTLPLKPEEEGKGTLDTLDVSVRVKADSEVASVGSNLAAAKKDGGFYNLDISQKTYRAPADLRVRIASKPLAARPASAWRSSLWSARSGGADGFFALAMTAPHALKNPFLKISGTRVYDVFPRRFSNIKAGQTVLLVGRYRAKGTARLSLKSSASGWERTPQFSPNRRADNPAMLLWAKEKIEDLSRNARNQSAVVALSTRYELPSKWTSWLAIPKEELERYKQEKAEADMAFYGDLVAKEIAAGRGQSRAARNARTRFARAVQDSGSGGKVQDEIKEYLYVHLVSLAAQHDELRPSRRAQKRILMEQMNRLARASGVNLKTHLAQLRREDDLDRAERARQAASDRQNRLKELLWDEARAGRANGRKAKALRAELDRVAKISRDDARSSLLAFYSEQLRDLARKAAELPAQSAERKKLVAQIGRVAKLTGKTPQSFLAVAEEDKRRLARQLAEIKESRELIEQLVEETRAGRVAGDKAQAARARLDQLHPTDTWRDNWNFTRALSDETNAAMKLYVAEKYSAAPSAEKLAQLQKRVDELTHDRLPQSARQLAELTEANDVAARLVPLVTAIVNEEHAASPDRAKIAQNRAELERLTKIAQASSLPPVPYYSDLGYSYVEVKDMGKLFKRVESQWANHRSHALAFTIAEEQSRAAPDAGKIAAWRSELDTLIDPQYRSTADDFLARGRDVVGRKVLAKIYRAIELPELQKAGAPKTMRDWQNIYAMMRKQMGNGLLSSAPEDQVVPTLSEIEEFSKQLSLRPELARDAKTKTRHGALKEKLYRSANAQYRWGDPLISIQAPADALQVVALMPDGTIKKLQFDAELKKWQARFDVPTWASEGDYKITIFIVRRDARGVVTKQRLVMTYRVDLSAPAGKGAATVVPSHNGATVRLELKGDAGTGRVAAILPGGEKIELKPSAADATRYFALANLPQNAPSQTVTFILTDRAHNRTVMTVNLKH